MTRATDRPYLPQMTQLDGDAYAKTLVQKLTPVADKVWNLATRLGGLPYRVFIVRTKWTGGKRNHGVEEVESVMPVLPTPEVGALTAQSQVLQAVGLDEVGSVMVTSISSSYTEDELVGLGPQGQPISDDRNFYWEIEFMRPLPDAPVRRRYVVKSSPFLDATAFGWAITLEKAGEERDRLTGQPAGT